MINIKLMLLVVGLPMVVSTSIRAWYSNEIAWPYKGSAVTSYSVTGQVSNELMFFTSENITVEAMGYSCDWKRADATWYSGSGDSLPEVFTGKVYCYHLDDLDYEFAGVDIQQVNGSLFGRFISFFKGPNTKIVSMRKGNSLFHTSLIYFADTSFGPVAVTLPDGESLGYFALARQLSSQPTQGYWFTLQPAGSKTLRIDLNAIPVTIPEVDSWVAMDITTAPVRGDVLLVIVNALDSGEVGVNFLDFNGQFNDSLSETISERSNMSIFQLTTSKFPGGFGLIRCYGDTFLTAYACVTPSVDNERTKWVGGGFNTTSFHIPCDSISTSTYSNVTSVTWASFNDSSSNFTFTTVLLSPRSDGSSWVVSPEYKSSVKSAGSAAKVKPSVSLVDKETVIVYWEDTVEIMSFRSPPPPTAVPTALPTALPTIAPTAPPTVPLTEIPTSVPTMSPNIQPTPTSSNTTLVLIIIILIVGAACSLFVIGVVLLRSKRITNQANHEELLDGMVQMENVTDSTLNSEPKKGWTIVKKIGRGSSGDVYEILMDNGKTEAVKVLHSLREESIKTLIAEFNIIKSLNHRNLIYYIDTERVGDDFYIFMEYTPEGSLADLIRRCKHLSATICKQYTRDIIQGLAYLHEKKILHRDIKAANVLIKGGVCKLADFGCIKVIDTIATSGTVVGTPRWMAPEVVNGSAYGTDSDIWSVGCTIHEMLTGSPPWPSLSSTWEMLYHIANSEPVLCTEGMDQLTIDILHRILNRDRARRPTTSDLLKSDWILTSTDSSLGSDSIEAAS